MEAQGTARTAKLQQQHLAKAGEPQRRYSELALSSSSSSSSSSSRYSELASSLLEPLQFAGRSEKSNADEERPVLR